MDDETLQPLRAAVNAEQANCAAAAGMLAKGIEALDRTERFVLARREAYERSRSALEKARAARASELQNALAAGSTIGLQVGADQRLVASEARDQEALSAAEGALSLARAKHARLQVEAQETGKILANAVDRLFLAEAESIAAQIIWHETQAVSLRERLIPLVPETRQRGEPIYPASQIVSNALQPPGLLETSRYFAMVGENGPHRARIAQHAQGWRTLRAALVTGADVDRAADVDSEAA